jgi:TonB-linked SusC/RagA family outer membrane protein
MRDFTLKRKWERLILTLIFCIAVFTSAFAQNIPVVGKVIDGATNEPIVGAAIKVKGSTLGVGTDINGNFKLSVPLKTILIIQSVGYENATVQAQSGLMTIKLTQTNNALNEVVVVGYGSEKKATVTGAVATVSSKVFEDRGPVVNPLESLQGQVAGVIVTRSSAQPGREGWNFQIRGATSTNNQDPLIVLDGVALSSNAELNSINPNDIDNISFLKDASAAIYGARAAFGVVLITTKKAKMGKMVVQYDVTVSDKLLALQPHLATDQQWGQGLEQALTNDNYGIAPVGYIWYQLAYLAANPPASGFIDVPSLPGYTGSSTGTPYPGALGGFLPPFGDVKDFTFFNTNQQKILWQNSTSQQHNLSFSGRTEKSGYRVSLGYLDDGSQLRYGSNGNQRYNLRLNHDYTFSDKVKLETNISLERQDIQQPSLYTTGGYSALGDYAQPGMPAFNAQGGGYAWGTVLSPAAELRDGGANLESDTRVLLNSTLTYNFAKHLTFTGTAGYNDLFADNRLQLKQVVLTNYVGNIVVQTNPVDGGTAGGNTPSTYYQRTNTTEPYYNLIARVQYTNTFNQVHNISVMLGSSYERDEFNSFNAKTFDLGNDNIPSLGLGVNSGAAGFVTDGETQNHYALGSYFARASYDYKGKYLFEATGRYDGSSKFISQDRWKLFGSAQAGWVVSDEAFMRNQKVLNFLKVRASYGTTGNQAGIGLYDYVQSLAVGSGAFLGSNNSTTVGVSGPLVSLNRTWETVKKGNIGIDFALINNHLTGSFDIFRNENSNMLLGQLFPGTLGASAPAQNIGDLQTWGEEAMITWKSKVGEVTYSISGTITDNQNKLVHYGGANTLGEGFNGTVEGYPLNSYFGLQYAGRLQTQAQVDAYNAKYAPTGSTNNINLPVPTPLANPAGQVSGLRPGDNSYKDVNGDGKLGIGTNTSNPGDLVYLGSNDPRYSFGLNLGLQWKGFDFYSIFQGVGKRTIYRTDNWERPFQSIYQGQTNAWVGNVWSPSTPNAYFPNLHSAQNNGINAYNYQASSWSVENGAYVRLKNLVIGYTLPQNVVKGLSKIRVYVSGSDLFELDHIHDGWDPEATRTISGNERYPFYRLVTVGANVTF